MSGGSYAEDELLSCCVLKGGKKAIAGSQTGLLNIFNYGEWEDYSDRFPGHPSSIDAMVKVDEDTILTGSSDGIVRIIGVLPNKMLGLVGEHSDMAGSSSVHSTSHVASWTRALTRHSVSKAPLSLTTTFT